MATAGPGVATGVGGPPGFDPEGIRVEGGGVAHGRVPATRLSWEDV